ncbi:MAG: M20/M25/M40 family metallo-hydrolase [Tindallia sp. MSAO_Bac2]|nr:MAG: M20/M25/M40 family metallo-hydrolase [Tindallia sp. MSAO_Bac2]
MKRSERIMQLMKLYMKEKTHTGTSMEKGNETFFANWFQDVPYFVKHPDYCGLYPIAGDHLNRRVPWALLKGKGKKTIVLVHHSDVVDADDYGKYSETAYDPEKITSVFKDGSIQMNDTVREDLESGKWIFGRGTADMKGGAAIHMALMEEYSRQEDFQGNLLLIAVPDEENLSAGMRGAIPLIKQLKELHDLDYILMLDVEPHSRPDENTALIQEGSVGKLMPVIYVRGKLSHVGQVYQGFNPVNLLSAIIRRTEVNPEFIETAGNAATPPPTWLYAKDQKNVYDVSLPIAAAGYMNLLTLDRSPAEIFNQLKEISENAFEEVINDIEKSYLYYSKVSLDKTALPEWKPKVRLFGELYQEALDDSGSAFIQEMESVMDEVKNNIANNEMTLIDGAYRMIETTLSHVKDLSPVVVIALAPPYYPNVNNSMMPEAAKPVNDAIDDLQKYSLSEWGLTFEVENYFTGICDLSYAMFQAESENIRYIEENMLLWKHVYDIPLEAIKELSMPVMNLGPWGKDFHKYTERVYLQDLLERTPILTDRLIKKMLGE